ncbi:MAG TPA: hypothetical protein DEP67_01485 [Lachnospiraceae bacterium]|nr:hypothetical protein [Lachnospiraceae bacterium]
MDLPHEFFKIKVIQVNQEGMDRIRSIMVSVRTKPMDDTLFYPLAGILLGDVSFFRVKKGKQLWQGYGVMKMTGNIVRDIRREFLQVRRLTLPGEDSGDPGRIGMQITCQIDAANFQLVYQPIEFTDISVKINRSR